VQTGTATPGTKLFKCLAEGLRLRILRLLARQELNVAELTAILDCPQSTLSRHLGVLREGGLIEPRRQGNATFYRFRTPERADGAGEAFAALLQDMLESEPFGAEDNEGLARALDERRARTREHFDEAGHTWDEFQDRYADHATKQRGLMRLIPRGLTVLDIGAGSGYLLPDLAEAGARVIAVDHAPRQLEKARRRAAELGLTDIDFREGDFGSLPVDDAEADAAFLHLALHHAPDPTAVLRDVFRALRPGGSAVLTEFSAHDQSWLRDEHADLWLGFDADELARDMRAAGFTDLRLERRPFVRDGVRERSGPASDLEVFVISGRKPLQP
jgi:ubiquinone/menaquinone biosynthesis C-methylase UbiE